MSPTYPIIDLLIRPDSPNRPGKEWEAQPFQGVRGIISHRTGNPGASARAHYNYFNALVDRNASAHYFVDAKEIVQLIPEDEIAWHCRGRNFDAIGIELCEPFHPDAYARYVWLHADICRRHGLDPERDIRGHFESTPSTGRRTQSASSTG